MAQGYTTRKLERYSIHAKPRIDYVDFFAAVCRTRYLEEQLGEDRIVFVKATRLRDGRVLLTAYEGDPGVLPLIFDPTSNAERYDRLRGAEILAAKTHALVAPRKRQAVIEYNLRGAKAPHLAVALESFARRHFNQPDFEFDLNPVISEDFATAIGRFERIQLASMRLSRPNPDWSPHYENLMGLAAESDARTIQIEVTAGRSNSLARGSGVIRYLKRLVQEPHSFLKAARVAGTREGEDQSTTVSLAHHVEHRRVTVKKQENGQLVERDILDELKSFLGDDR
jgi:hypothetical protein